jgi:hypothetical protein
MQQKKQQGYEYRMQSRELRLQVVGDAVGAPATCNLNFDTRSLTSALNSVEFVLAVQPASIYLAQSSIIFSGFIQGICAFQPTTQRTY